MPSQGDIVLVEVPFSDLSRGKPRPAMVISNDAYHRATSDMVVVGLTSNPDRVLHSFTLTSADLASGKLERSSQVRVDKIYAMSQRLIRKTFGRVKSEIIVKVQREFEQLTNP